MKKLILLAVVVFGFAATSFAQVSASGGANGVINLPPAASPLSINWVQDMDFGTITNKTTSPSIGGGAWIALQPNGNVGVTTSGANISYTGVPKYAKFLVKNVNKLNNNIGLVDGDITLTNNSDHTLSAGNAWFDTSSAGTPNAILGAISYTSVDLVQGTTNYFVSIGGALQMNKDATGSFNVAGLTVTVNNH